MKKMTLIFLAVLMVLFAGCASNKASEAATSATTAMPDVEFSDKDFIDGIVYEDNKMTIKGVST